MTEDVRPAELILHNGRFSTLDRAAPAAAAVAIAGGRFVAVGEPCDVVRYAGPDTTIIDLGRRSALPGLVESKAAAPAPPLALAGG